MIKSAFCQRIEERFKTKRRCDPEWESRVLRWQQALLTCQIRSFGGFWDPLVSMHPHSPSQLPQDLKLPKHIPMRPYRRPKLSSSFVSSRQATTSNPLVSVTVKLPS